MTTNVWDTVWERVRAGQHTVVIGLESIPVAPNDLWMLLVRCNAPWTTGGPLDEALHRVLKLLGRDPQQIVQGDAKPVSGVRSRLLGDERSGRTSDAVFVEACNQLAAWANGHAVLGFEAIDAADMATVSTMTHLLRHQGWLRLPVILTVQEVPQGLVAELVKTLREMHGADAILEADVGALPHPISSSFESRTLAEDIIRVLRAGSVIGTEFEAELVAQLLDQPLGTVLETLQRAADAGVALADRGEGRFFVPADVVQALQRTMLPSLRTYWHAQLGTLLSEGRTPAHETPPERTTRASDTVGEDSRRRQIKPVPEDVTGPAEPSPSSSPYAAMFEQPLKSAATQDESVEVPPEAAEVAPEAPPLTWTAGPQAAATAESLSPLPLADEVRAATHLQASGQTDAAVAQYLAAVQEVATRGDARRAYALAQQGLVLLDELPPSELRALRRVQLLLALGQVQWHSAVLGAPFTLDEALRSLEFAKAALPDTASPAIAGQLAAVTAGVCYDLGHLEALQHALNELTTASRRLIAEGEPLLAAGLLNDQAALYVRLGDPVRAAHLLSESRRLFDSVLRAKPDDQTAVAELAATEHLLARLPLHSAIRPGHEDEAYAISLDHALAAESAYERLQQPWDVGRVWETIGRLELARGRPEAARGRLSTALQLQKQIGDVTGLARSTAALADLCIASGQLGEAAALLSDSVALNFEKGSPIGLAFNRRAFDTLQGAERQAQDPKGGGVQQMLQEVEGRLVQAESVLGQMVLPGEPEA